MSGLKHGRNGQQNAFHPVRVGAHGANGDFVAHTRLIAHGGQADLTALKPRGAQGVNRAAAFKHGDLTTGRQDIQQVRAIGRIDTGRQPQRIEIAVQSGSPINHLIPAHIGTRAQAGHTRQHRIARLELHPIGGQIGRQNHGHGATTARCGLNLGRDAVRAAGPIARLGPCAIGKDQQRPRPVHPRGRV